LSAATVLCLVCNDIIYIVLPTGRLLAYLLQSAITYSVHSLWRKKTCEKYCVWPFFCLIVMQQF